VVGSEGTFGIVTRATLRLVRTPEAYRTLLAVFDSVEAASEAVSGIIGAGIVPAALEMMDRLIIGAVEAAYRIGLPTDAGAVLLVEIDGPAAGLDDQLARIGDVCRAHGSLDLRIARDEAERAALWKARKRAFGAVGRLAPNYCTQDGVVPRTRVPDILRAIQRAAEKHRSAPATCSMPATATSTRSCCSTSAIATRWRACWRPVARSWRPASPSAAASRASTASASRRSPDALLFAPDDLLAMTTLRAVFDPEQAANPHKIFPDAKVCVETRAPRRQVPIEPTQDCVLGRGVIAYGALVARAWRLPRPAKPARHRATRGWALGCAPGDDHGHTLRGDPGDVSAHDANAVAGLQRELGPREKRRQDDLHLVEREGHAETAAPSSTEWQELVEARPRSDEPLRPKPVGLRPGVGSAMRAVDVRGDAHASRDLDAADAGRPFHEPHDVRDDRVQRRVSLMTASRYSRLPRFSTTTRPSRVAEPISLRIRS
jgi:hypothetical protein